ncbi:MAG: lysoplasmalogenase [Ferruginibacter sp.]
MLQRSTILPILFGILSVCIVVIEPYVGFGFYAVNKALLMPTLAIWILATKTYHPSARWIVFGLIFSCLGDVFLLFQDQQSGFFIAGLASFLTTHILYIISFLKLKSPQSKMINGFPIISALIVFYGIALVNYLYPNLHALTPAVIVYSLVICSMLISTLLVISKDNINASIATIAGAASFVISDSILAINKFSHPITYSGALIMGTYCLAQFLIVWATIHRFSVNNPAQ